MFTEDVCEILCDSVILVDNEDVHSCRASYRQPFGWLKVAYLVGGNSGDRRTFGLSSDRQSVTRRMRMGGNLRLGCCNFVATRGLPEREPLLRANLRAAYWLPAAAFPAFRMEVAAAKMRAAL